MEQAVQPNFTQKTRILGGPKSQKTRRISLKTRRIFHSEICKFRYLKVYTVRFYKFCKVKQTLKIKKSWKMTQKCEIPKKYDYIKIYIY